MTKHGLPDYLDKDGNPVPISTVPSELGIMNLSRRIRPRRCDHLKEMRKALRTILKGETTPDGGEL